MKWLMNPDNNPTILGIALGFVCLCIVLSFMGAKP